MAPSAQTHHRSHSLLLFQKLLNLRDSASPLTLILDTLEQGAEPLVQEFISRGKLARSKVLFVSFTTVRKPHDVDIFIKARGKPVAALITDITSHCAPPKGQTPKDAATNCQRFLIVVDSLNPLASKEPHALPLFFGSIINPFASLVAVYHNDVPLVLPRTVNEYEPHPLTLLSHMATAIFRVSSLYQAVETKRAQMRSLREPEWGLHEGREGVLVGLWTGHQAEGLVVEMEMRRRSGRAVAERFILSPSTQKGGAGASLSLLSDHPLFAPQKDAEGGAEGEMADTTFKLGLTEKQRSDREGIVLPYFDAQTEVGGGEGGRILYDMGREDDFDDEEDEI
ncbi:Elongator complex protein 5 [Pseudoneurospora amorphoporcata]|uniref:Elongator complex protein 5 n=1 Tax=Pseudoneurospora amorphoporcata TaxID=241081 RepID=A0AAN6SFX3_9PEZI|nr:Elongator complex protein 5 [Pseudoneurospora amorphoporcata]